MVFRILILALLFTACRSGEIACPDPVTVKLRKKPGNYGLKTSQKSLTASSKEVDREKPFKFPEAKNVKSAASIEEWDCPKPGSKTMPKSVKENIKKNRKKFDAYYRAKVVPDSLTAGTNRP
jgi:hypothetical protein